MIWESARYENLISYSGELRDMRISYHEIHQKSGSSLCLNLCIDNNWCKSSLFSSGCVGLWTRGWCWWCSWRSPCWSPWPSSSPWSSTRPALSSSKTTRSEWEWKYGGNMMKSVHSIIDVYTLHFWSFQKFSQNILSPILNFSRIYWL